MGLPETALFSNIPNKKNDAPNKKRSVGIPVYDNRIQRSCDDGIRLRSAAAGRSRVQQDAAGPNNGEQPGCDCGVKQRGEAPATPAASAVRAYSV